MELFLLNLGKLSLLGGAVIALLLGLRPQLRKRYCAKMFYWLWLSLAVLLLLPMDYSLPSAPVQIEAPTDYTIFVGSDKTTVVQTEAFFAECAGSPVEMRNELAASEPMRYISVTGIVFSVYLLGVAVFLLVQSVRCLRLRHTIRRWKTPCTEEGYLRLLREEAELRRVTVPQLAVCEAVPTPMLVGVWHPTLLVPHEQYPESDLRFILCHELTHLKRHDMLYKLVLLGANALHWFNPLVYLMLRTADADVELSCDSDATCGMERREKIAYSKTLLSAVQEKRHAVAMTSCFGGTGKRLKLRIGNVLGGDKRRGSGIAIGILLAILALGATVSWEEKEEPASSAEVFPAMEGDALPQRGSFTDIFGLSGYFEIEMQEYFSICRYYTTDGALLAESYGYERNDYVIDLDGDGITELVCNCVSGGDGHEEVYLYRLKDGVVELGFLDIESLHLSDYLNWGVNSTAFRYDAQNHAFVLTYTSAQDNAKSNERICTYEEFIFSRWLEGTYTNP